MGGSLGKSKNNAGSSFSNSVWGPQGDALQQLYDQAFNSFNGAPDSVGNTEKVFDNATGAWIDQSNGGAFGDSQVTRDKLFSMMEQPSQMGQMYNSIVGGEGNEYIDPLIDRMRGDASKTYETLKSNNALDAAALGQSGSSRQAMENAMLGSEVSDNLNNQIATARAGAYDKDLNLKLNIAQQADNNRQAEQDRLFDMLSGANNSQSGAVNQTSNMMTNALGNQMAWFNPLINLANVIGAPIMEGSGSSSSKGKGFGTGGGLW